MEEYLQKGFRMMLAGAPADLIFEQMQRDGVDSLKAVNGIVDLHQHSKRVEHFRSMAKEYYLWMATVSRQLRIVSAQEAVDEVECSIKPDEFYGRYYTQNRPVVIRNLLSRWTTFSHWSFDMLANQYGDTIIEVTIGRSDDRDHDMHPELHREEMRLNDFIRFARTEVTNERYLVAQNKAFQGMMCDLKQTIDPLPGILQRNEDSDAFLWLGPRGTVTHLHYDNVNVLHVMIDGSKRFIFTPPEDASLVYNHVGVFSEVDAANPDLSRHPLFASARRFEVTVNAGDAVFIPVGWWHYVEGLTPTLAVSFSNFARANMFPRVS